MLRCAETGAGTRRLLYLLREGLFCSGPSCRPTLSPPGHCWPDGLRGLQEACEESRVPTPILPVPGMGLWRGGMLSLCPPCAADEEGLKDTRAGGELRLPCSSSCCSLGFLCQLQSDDGRGSLLSCCSTGTWASTFPLCSPGLGPLPRSESLAGGVLSLLCSPVSIGCCWSCCWALCPSQPGDRGSAFASSWGWC